MVKNFIRKMWELRGKIDEAMSANDINKFEKAKMNFYKIFLKQEYLNQLSLATVNVEYETEEAFNRDCEANFAMIAYNIYELQKIIQGKANTLHEIQFNSVLEVLWYTRDVFDVFVDNVNNPEVKTEDNLAIFASIAHNFQEMIMWYKVINDDEAMLDLVVLEEILQEVLDKRDELYPHLVEEIYD